MVVPGMMNMAEVMAESGYTEEDVFDCGISGQIVFLVVVPLVGACRVPIEALSHFMAGADDYAAEGMPEHWSGALSGKWTIKRDRLRILDQSWTAFSDECDKLAEALQQSDYQKTPEFQAEYASAWKNLEHIDDLDREIQTWEATSATDIQQLDRKEQKIAALREKRAALHKSVFPGDSQQQTIESQATTPSPAPVVVVGASGGSTTVWTTERKKDALAMMNLLRGQGVRAFAANTAAAFGVTPTRLREVLNDKPKKAPAKKPKGVWGI